MDHSLLSSGEDRQIQIRTNIVRRNQQLLRVSLLKLRFSVSVTGQNASVRLSPITQRDGCHAQVGPSSSQQPSAASHSASPRAEPAPQSHPTSYSLKKLKGDRPWSFQMFEESMPPVELSPVALFQIIKDIKMGPSRGFSSGVLFGIPCDPKHLDDEHPIEVTTAFPDFSPQGFQRPARVEREQDRIEFEKYRADRNRNTTAHCEALKDLHMDFDQVGTYTSRNTGTVMHFDDLNCLCEEQREYRYSFKLIVTINDQSISFKAFRISQATMEYLQRSRYLEIDGPLKVDEKMLFENMLVSVPVKFRQTQIDQLMLNEMLASFSLIADVFRLRKMDTLKPEMDSLTDTMDDLTEDLAKPVQDKTKSFVYDAYEYHAKSRAVRTALDEEKLKMQALMALGATNK